MSVLALQKGLSRCGAVAADFKSMPLRTREHYVLGLQRFHYDGSEQRKGEV
jgi:hypothetical protein